MERFYSLEVQGDEESLPYSTPILFHADMNSVSCHLSNIEHYKNTEWIFLLVIFNTGVRIVKKIANRIDSRWGDIPGGKETCGSLEGHFLITDARSHLLDLGSRNKGRSNQWSQVISHI